MTKRIALREVDQLSAAEKILLAQDLWDSVADDPNAWPLTAAQRTELARRDRALERDIKAGKPLGVSWAQAKRQARRGKR
jgi:putative addiction module component (TIGR02574 family)